MNTLHRQLLHVVKIHYLLLALVAAQIMAYDAWQLITPEAVQKR